MASGKQLSFQYGEVSPTLKYRSDAVSYAQGLGKLRNMYVRRSGGVSNRSGLEYVKTADSQVAVPAPGGPMGVKSFTFWSYKDQTWKTLEYYKINATDYNFYLDGTEVYDDSVYAILGPEPQKIKFTPLKEDIFITPNLDTEAGIFNATISYEDETVSGAYGDILLGGGLPFGTVTTIGYNGLAPFLPVSYIVTALREDGIEDVIYNVESAAISSPSSAPATIVHPHSSLTSFIKFVLPSAMPNVKAFNLYRAPGRGGLATSFYKLAGKSRYDGTSLTLEFHDYGAEDVTSTPCLDKGSVFIGQFKGANAAAYYQQRLLMAMEPGTGSSGNDIPESVKAGDILASKIGAPRHIVPPVIFSNTGAFQFSIPITDGTPCVALLPMERLIAFTERGTYIVRGGEQGVLTPTTVNPLCISEEGCSKIVEPVMSGRKGYFINATHTKLMAIEFGVDGNVDVFEASVFSDHFLLQDIVQIVSLGGGEDTVYLLRRDGKLARITAVEEGAHGFALMETDGYIESIYRGKALRPYTANSVDPNAEKYYDVLMCYVIRNGLRTLERLNVREDRYREGEFYADCYMPFGMRLSDYGNAGYKKIGAPDSNNPKINIPTPASWLAGATIPIWSSHTLDAYVNVGAGGGVIHFFYEDANSEENYIRFYLTASSHFATGNGTYPHGYSGHFDVDVPTVLRDVVAQSLSTLEKNKRLTRWLPAVNVLETPNLAGVILTSGIQIGTAGTVDVTVVADGEVVSSPLNPNKDTLSVEVDTSQEGVLNLPDYYSYGYVGLPYTAEFETMDLESGDNRTLTDANKIINSIGVGFYETRGGFYGMPNKEIDEMEELNSREDVIMANQTSNENDYLTIPLPAEYTRSGRVNIKQVDPAPMTILAVYPKGISGD